MKVERSFRDFRGEKSEENEIEKLREENIKMEQAISALHDLLREQDSLRKKQLTELNTQIKNQIVYRSRLKKTISNLEQENQLLQNEIQKLKEANQAKEISNLKQELKAAHRTNQILLSKVNAIEDIYNLLGLEKTATDQEVKDAYRELSLTIHPDKNKMGKSLFQQLSNAKEKWEKEKKGF